MKVILDENGIALSDVAIQSFIEHTVGQHIDIHVSNMTTITILRAYLVKMPVDSRPKITWIFYNKEVHFDDNLRSDDAWQDSRTAIADDALLNLM